MHDPLLRLGLGRRKFCLGRWLGMAAFGEVSRVLVDLDEPEDATNEAKEEALELEQAGAREALEAATAIALRDDAEDVDEFLAKLAPGIAALNGWGPGSHPYLEALKGRVDAFLAAPLDPFETVFATALEVATEFYDRAGFGPDLPPTRCELSVGPGKDPCPPSRPAVNGSLKARSGGTIVASLKLTAAKFWREEVCALTYATLHELVVHGFAADHARPSVDAFAEGWMDFVAFQLHEQLELERLPQRAPLSADFPAAQQGHHASIAHAARSAGKPLIETGRVAARMAQNALYRHLPTDADARAAMWAFSATLNRSPINSSRRSDLCELIASDRTETRVFPAFVAAAEDILAASDRAEKLEIARDFDESVP